ncbi:MAG: CtsR family transcriptional regulator [Clostridia bacterium]|nr:MAG: CtsR family transcriptional regulator [Clostridia bacterium]
MRSLADKIENYLKELLGRSQGSVEIQRSELAQVFDCVPSQINYVLSTRFTVEQGYLVESRRGGGGYLRIVKLPLTDEGPLRRLIEASVDRLTSQQVGEGLIGRLVEEGFLTKREGKLMRAVIDREVLALPLPERDLLRSRLIRAMLLVLLQDDFD